MAGWGAGSGSALLAGVSSVVSGSITNEPLGSD
jgi:hypothetical protein